MNYAYLLFAGIILAHNICSIAADNYITIDVGDKSFYVQESNIGASSTLSDLLGDMDNKNTILTIRSSDLSADDFNKYFLQFTQKMAALNDATAAKSTKDAYIDNLNTKLQSFNNDELVEAAYVSSYLNTPLMPLIEEIITRKMHQPMSKAALRVFSQLHLDVQNQIGRKAIALQTANTKLQYTLLPDHNRYVDSVTYSPNGKQLASASGEIIKLWDLNTGQPQHILTNNSYLDTVNSVTYSPNGKQLASGSSDDSIKLWDPNTGKLLHTLTGHNNIVNSVSYSPNGKQLASGSSDKTIKMWNANTGQLICTLTGHTDPVNSVAYSPSGNQIASGARNKTIKIWDANAGQLIYTLTGHNNAVISVAYSPHGNQIASGSLDNTIKLWDPYTGKLQDTLTGHNRAVISVAYNPYANQIASGSSDGTIKLWDPHTGKLQDTLTGHNLSVKSVAYNPYANQIASGSSDETIKLWQVGAIAQDKLTLSLAALIIEAHQRKLANQPPHIICLECEKIQISDEMQAFLQPFTGFALCDAHK